MNSARFFLFVFLLSSQFAFTQSASQTDEIKALNNYVQFANESMHGLLIVHRLLENFNQEVNKYVDLQSNQLNFYGNTDLPKNIFLDPQNWFYEISPTDWYQLAQKESSFLPKQYNQALNANLTRLKSITDEINAIRFQIEDFIAKEDLTQTDKQGEIYGILERCVDLYDTFFAEKEQLSEQLYQAHQALIEVKDTKFNQQIDAFGKIHHTVKSIMESLHFGRMTEVPNLATALKVQIEELQQYPTRNRHYDAVLTTAREVLTWTQQYIDQGAFPEKYKLYGKAYYYHNVELASSFNRYGGGLVKNMNEFIALANPTRLPLLEQPHYYKVIYPKKDVNVPQQEQIIEELPARLNDRNIVVRQQKVVVDEKKLLLEIYDHKQADGDIISLNFNGNWIMEEKELAKRPIKLLVELNEEGENYLILHAKNLGAVPPNTIAVRYYYEGVRKIVVLNSDLNESEMIRLEYQPSK